MHVSTGVLLPVPCYTIISPSYAALQIVSNTPALKKKSLLAVISAVCQIYLHYCYLHHLLLVLFARVPTRYWHWQSVTEKNDSLNTSLSFF